MKAKIDNYSDEEFKQIIQQSSSFSDVCRELGYSKSGASVARIKLKIDQLQISTDHFGLANKTPIVRTEENVFIENSTAAQKTLRRWYLQGAYTPYICSICGQEPIWQNKELTLILDHINGINTDDRLENLRWVCPNCNMQLPTTNGKNKKTLNQKNFCKDCGKEIDIRSERCIQCHGKTQIVPLDKMLVTREELKELIRTTPFTTIGKQFGVTDNAVRKWCEKFSLPKKSSEIKKISDEDWAKI